MNLKNSCTRAGNTLIVALGVVVLVAGVAFISTDSAMAVLKSQDISQKHTRAIAALEAVLARREIMVSRMATDGTLIDWTGDASQKPNYGLDVVGECLVKWKIEPVHSPTSFDVDGSATTNAIPFIANPVPGSSVPQPVSNLEVSNGYSYMFVISGESTLPASNGRETPAIVQGARYVAVAKLPLFRYVINYLRDGAAGDLELSHDPAVEISGSVNSNGSIYVGSNTMVNDWSSAYGGSGATKIGTDVKPVKVNAVNGIFRLSKPTFFGALNGLPMANGSKVTTPATFYTLGIAELFAPETIVPDPDFDIATKRGRVFNPYRIKNGTGSEDWTTRGSTVRSINGVSLEGIGSGANDSRDLSSTTRVPFAEWAPKPAALGGFSGFVLTDKFQARPEAIPDEFKDRGLEPQALRYRDTDADAATDDHDFALPVFVGTLPENTAGQKPAVTEITRLDDASRYWTDVLGRTDTVKLIEKPGQYIKYIIGSNFMARRPDGTGWDMVNAAGAPVAGPVTDAKAGLLIRERPLPATAFWPGTTDPNNYLRYGDRDAVPYALGKHWKPVLMPFTKIDVTDNLWNGDTNAAWFNIATSGNDRNAESARRAVTYSMGGIVSITSATGVSKVGPNAGGWQGDGLTHAIRQDIPGDIPAIDQKYTRNDRYHTDTWRFVHLKRTQDVLTKAEISALPSGLRYWYWKNNGKIDTLAGNADDTKNLPYLEGGNSDPERQPFLGAPDYTGIASTVNQSLPWQPSAAPATLAGVLSDYYSSRWAGYIIPPQTGSYTFRIKADDGGRLWLDDRLMAEKWSYDNQWHESPVLLLAAGEPSKVIMEMYEGGGGDDIDLQWNGPGTGGWQTVPNTYLRAAPAIGGFDRSKFTSVVARLWVAELNNNTLNTQKAALMIRPCGAEADMLSGRDRYVALGFSPARGVFLEQRREPSFNYNRYSPATANWIGGGSYTQGTNPLVSLTNGDGAVSPAPMTGNYNGNAYTVTRSPVTLTRQSPPVPSKVGENMNDWADYVQSSKINPSTINDVNLGDGVVVNVTYGGWMETGFYRRYKRGDVTMRRDYEFLFSSGVTYPFALTGSQRPDISLYNDGTTSTTTNVEYTLNAYWANGSGTALYKRQEQTFSGNTVSADSGSLTFGSNDARQIWKPAGGWQGYTPSRFVDKLNSINWNGKNNWILGENNGDGPIQPGLPSIALSDPAYPTTTVMDVWWDDQPHSFSMSVSASSRIRTDSNPWTSRTGVWNAVASPLVFPWDPLWTTKWGIPAPLTYSVRPDVGLQNVGLASSVVPGAGSIENAAIGLSDDIAPPAAGTNYVWLGIDRDAATNSLSFRYAYSASTTTPLPGSWNSVAVAGGNIPITSADWSSLLVGPAAQSGNVATPMTATFGGLEVITSENIGNNDGKWNSIDWDKGIGLTGVATPYNRWMASQYQVFFGTDDITEDFFSWGDDQAQGDSVAKEDIFYNPREYWSQAPSFQVWDQTVPPLSTFLWGGVAGRSVWSPFASWKHRLKEPGQAAVWAKTTVLNLNMKRVFEYLNSRDIIQATTLVIGASATPPVAATKPLLAKRFNGLIYAARTNRYPFNPNQPLANSTLDADGNPLKPGWQALSRDEGGQNPWSFSAVDLPYPNSSTANDKTLYGGSGASWSSSGKLDVGGIHKLNPYPSDTLQVLPIRPQQFHHGVMVSKAANIKWHPDAKPTFGDAGLSFVTPNALYVNGDFNSTANTVLVNSVETAKVANAAVMGDSVILLSNAFEANMPAYREQSILSSPTGPKGSDTTYNMGIVTHNQPTNLYRVVEGQSAPFIDTMMLMEDWAGKKMKFQGSLVVLDTRRYTDAFLLDGVKKSGRGPNGYMSGPSSWFDTWPTMKGGIPDTYVGTIPKTNSVTPQVYVAPAREFIFQIDFLTKDGTPPFSPFGMTSTGVGGWTRIVN